MRQVRYRRADHIAPYFSKVKGSPMVYSALFNSSNFHANAKYVKYAHHRGVITVNARRIWASPPQNCTKRGGTI